MLSWGWDIVLKGLCESFSLRCVGRTKEQRFWIEFSLILFLLNCRPDTSSVYVDLGLNDVWLELELDKASEYCEKRLQIMNRYAPPPFHSNFTSRVLIETLFDSNSGLESVDVPIARLQTEYDQVTLHHFFVDKEAKIN